MKGIKHIFLRLCKQHNVKIIIGDCWQSLGHAIVVPEQRTDGDLFIGFHELAHHVLHLNDKRDYDDLLQRIHIEQEADKWANDQMRAHGYQAQLNDATSGLIALYLYQGNQLPTYSIAVEDRFIVLCRYNFEIFSHFISQLPMHPVVR